MPISRILLMLCLNVHPLTTSPSALYRRDIHITHALNGLDAFPVLHTQLEAQSLYVRVEVRGIDKVGHGSPQPGPRNYLPGV